MLYHELTLREITNIKHINDAKGPGFYCIADKLDTFRVFRRSFEQDGYIFSGGVIDEHQYYYDIVHFTIKENIDFTKELLAETVEIVNDYKQDGNEKDFRQAPNFSSDSDDESPVHCEKPIPIEAEIKKDEPVRAPTPSRPKQPVPPPPKPLFRI